MDMNKYRIDLLSVGADPVKYEFALDNQYFKDIDGPEIQKGNVKAIVEVSRKHSSFVLNFKFDGCIVVTCDRCLDDMDLPVSVESELKVRFGDEYRDDDEWGDVVYDDSDVFAWMPLPTPYKGGDDE